MKHHFLHWLAVVVLRTISFILSFILSLYLATIGFWLSEKIFSPYWLSLIPYSRPIKNFILLLANRWYFQEVPFWWGMVVGIPLILLAVSIFLINFFNLYYSLFSPTYNQTHCPFCKTR